MMNVMVLIWVFLSAAGLNAIIYYVFKKYIMKMANPAMVFLMINIFKDLIWVGYWLLNLENSKANFLAVIVIFLLTSFFLYFKVIRLLNRS